MGLLPNLSGIDPAQTVQDFLAALHSINHKLDVLIGLQREGITATQEANDRASQARLRDVTAARQSAEAAGLQAPDARYRGNVPCVQCEEGGRLRCRFHGPEKLAEHEVNQHGDVVFCPNVEGLMIPREHQVDTAGRVVRCIDPRERR